MKTAVGVSLLFHGILLPTLALHKWPAPQSSDPVPLAVSLTLPPAPSPPKAFPAPEPVREEPLSPVRKPEAIPEWEQDTPAEETRAAETVSAENRTEPGESSPPGEFSPTLSVPSEPVAFPPSLISELTVTYPYKARKKGYEGQVLCRVWIGTNGAVTDALVCASSGYDLLDQAALDAVRRAEYTPGSREDFIDINVIFALS